MTDRSIPEITSAASPPRRDLEPDQIVTDETPLAQGGQAAVYKGSIPDAEPPNWIALKEPLGSETLEAETVDRFLAEAHSWETVDARERQKPRWRDSEYVVGVIDTGEDRPWIAMEYMDGGALDARLEGSSGGLPLDKALWIGECVCKGIEVSHSYGIAHLDLKPANILFRKTPGGVWNLPKVADWGSARVLAEQTGAVDTRSPRYSAPEQFEPGEFGDPDMLTDVYQVGALVYSMLTGEPPYIGPQFSVISDIIARDPPDPPSARSDGIPEPVDEAVLSALQPYKSDRYDGIQGFKQTLSVASTVNVPVYLL